MFKLITALVSVTAQVAVMLIFDASAAETLRKLGGAQIRAKVSGMELSDGVHSRDAFRPDGTLTSYGMGRKTVGVWRIRGDELCIAPGKDEQACYLVWASGNKIELRHKDSQLPIMEGELTKIHP